MNLRSLALAAVLAVPGAALADHTYQVTGDVVSADASSIVVHSTKYKENWEIGRGDDKTEVKKGDKITIEYTMTAKKVEVKSAAKSSGGSSTKKAAAPAK
jgi:hypothetical protein